MRYIAIEVPVSNNEYGFLKALAEYDKIDVQQELVNLARLQLLEEMELKDAELRGEQ